FAIASAVSSFLRASQVVGDTTLPVPNCADPARVAAWSWGDNSAGQLGDGSGSNSPRPVQVAGLTGVIAIAAGGWHSLALTNDHTVWAWGLNENGQLGIGATAPSQTKPVQLPGLSNVVQIAAGFRHSLALTHDLTVWAWGDNSNGQLGDAQAGPKRPTPGSVS